MTLFRPGFVLVVTVSALLLFAPASAVAKTTGVGEDLSLQSGPCYQALIDKNAETPTTAPNRELGAACQAENGDITKAWARVQRLWGSDSAEVPDYDSYRPADAPVGGSTPLWLMFAAIVLLYCVAATPFRSVAGLMSDKPGKALLAGEVVVALAMRSAVAFALLALFNVPVVALIGEVVLIGLLLYGILSRRKPDPVAADDGSAGASARFVADAINDVAGGWVGLIGLALAANHNGLLLAASLVTALVLSVPQLVIARRRLRLSPLARTATSALLAAAVALFIVNEPIVVSLVNGAAYPAIALPIILAAATAGAGWLRWGPDMLQPTARRAIG